MNDFGMTTTLEDSPKLFTVQQVCHRLELGRSTVYKLLENGALRSVKIGHSRRIRSNDFEEFVRALDAADEE